MKDERTPPDTPEIPVEVEGGAPEPPAEPPAPPESAGGMAPVEAPAEAAAATATAAAPAPAPAQPALEEKLQAVEEKLQAVDKERKDLYDRLLRTAADFDNFRKRSRKDMEEARIKAREEVLREILPVIDNLERAVAAALESSAGSATGVVEGVKLVLRQFQNALERFDVKGFTSIGEPFDPTRHEAIAQVETAEAPPGTVFTEMQKGYVIGQRLLRPALVSVAKAPPPDATPTPPADAADGAPPEPAAAAAAEATVAAEPEPPKDPSNSEST